MWWINTPFYLHSEAAQHHQPETVDYMPQQWRRPIQSGNYKYDGVCYFDVYSSTFKSSISTLTHVVELFFYLVHLGLRGGCRPNRGFFNTPYTFSLVE